MSFIEMYSGDILDTVSIGKIASDFNESMGDYIKVQILGEGSDMILGTVYSNRLLLRFSDIQDDSYYLGPYHYHPENPDMGFCTGKEHNNSSISNLLPVTIGNYNSEPLNSQSVYKRQFDIFRDDSGEIYIKPNEIFKLFQLLNAKYRVRIYFLRNIKSTLGKFLNSNKNNLIENGNFFAGLEATQTGDLDKSTGRNNFILKSNPGESNFILEQDGIKNNIYDMMITGIYPNSYYIFSCWVAWNIDFSGNLSIVSFNDASRGLESGIIPTDTMTDSISSYTDNVTDDSKSGLEHRPSRILDKKVVDNLIWYKLFYKVNTNSKADSGSVRIKLGTFIENQSINPFGRRYFTDLRFEKIKNFDSGLSNYIEQIGNEFRDIDAGVPSRPDVLTKRGSSK